MDQAMIISSLISGGVGAMGALIGAFIGGKYSYKGATIAVKEQISFQSKLLKEEQEANEEITKRMLETFLAEEIKYNFGSLGSKDNRTHLKKLFENNNKPFGNYFYDQGHFKFEEFDFLKKEVFRIESNSSREIIEIYVVFKILHNSGNTMERLTQEQYEFVKRIYIKYCDKY